MGTCKFISSVEKLSPKSCLSLSVPCHWILFPLPGLPGWTSVGEDVCSPAGTRCPRVVGTQGGGSLSLRRRGGGNEWRDL